MDAEATWIPQGEVTEESLCETLKAWAETGEPHWQHILEITLDTATSLSSDVYLIENAKIPAVTCPTGDCEMEAKTDKDLEGKELTVFTLSGEATRLRVPTSHTTAEVKQRLESKLGVPAFLQRLLDGSEEIADEAVVTGDSVTLLQRDPPKVETEDFLRSMVECVSSWDSKDIFRRWRRFDTYHNWPTSKEKQLEWAMQHRDMVNVPLTTESVLECFDAWLELQEPYAHDDDLEMVFFFVGRLRMDPQMFVVQSLHLNCWI